MIRLTDTSVRQAGLFELCKNSAFGCKLAAIARAYGFGRNFVRFWTDASAAYCLLDGQLTVAGTPEDADEAAEFIATLGPGALLCPETVARSLGFNGTGGPVLEKLLPDGKAVSLGEPPKLGDISGLLLEAGMLNGPGAAEAFYLDLSHRLRHGVALAAGEYRNERLAGCGIISAMVGDEALLSALAVDERWWRQGIGSRLLHRLEAAIPGRKLWLLREEGHNQEFYQSLGFLEADRWRQVDMSK